MLFIAVTLFALWSYTSYGNLRSGYLRLGGWQLIADEEHLDFGTVRAGESKSGVFRLKNLTGKPVAILGMESDCSCVSAVELPMTIPAGKTFDFELVYRADDVDSKTEVIRRVILNLSVDQPIRVLEVRVTIVPNNKEKQNDS